jgi:hypothetical protein
MCNERKMSNVVIRLSALMLMACLAAASSFAQTSGSIEVSKAEASNLGRGAGDKSMYAKHVVNYCLSGGNSKSGNMVLVEFVAKGISADSAASGKGPVRGRLSSVQEPLGGKQRCGSFTFDVNVDSMVSTPPLAKEANPRIIVSTLDGALIASKSVVEVTTRSR